MNRTTITRSIGIVLLVIQAAVLSAQDIIENFKVPDYNEQGVKTSEMVGKTARFLKGGLIEITGLEIEFYENGQVSGRVTAPQCVYDQKKEEASSDGDVLLDRGSLTVTGKGFTYNRATQVFSIHSKARVVIENLAEEVKETEE